MSVSGPGSGSIQVQVRLCVRVWVEVRFRVRIRISIRIRMRVRVRVRVGLRSGSCQVQVQVQLRFGYGTGSWVQVRVQADAGTGVGQRNSSRVIGFCACFLCLGLLTYVILRHTWLLITYPHCLHSKDPHLHPSQVHASILYPAPPLRLPPAHELALQCYPTHHGCGRQSPAEPAFSQWSVHKWSHEVSSA